MAADPLPAAPTPLTSPAAPTPLTPPTTRSARNPISRALFDKVLGRVIALAGLIFGLQALPTTMAQIGVMQIAWAWLIGLGMLGAIVAVGVASVLVRGVETTCAILAVSYLVALITWPLAVVEPEQVLVGVPWLWYLCTVATAAAAYAFSAWIAIGYSVVVPLVYGLIRLTPSGGGESLSRAALDSTYAILLGGAVLVLVLILRQASAAVDAAQATAVARYSGAIREHATELERVQVDAIVHDSVLTTFIQAARAYTPEQQVLATTMARNAMAHLTSAAATTPFDESTTTLGSLRTRLVDAVAATGVTGVTVELRADDADDRVLPTTAAEALVSAAAQALVNSSQHAGPATLRRWVALERTGDAGVLVEVGDDGAGFDPGTVPDERLGVRVSIIERVANAGGRACIDSRPGAGTVVRLMWPTGLVVGPSREDAS
jgi:signal transduction histidine kinase